MTIRSAEYIPVLDLRALTDEQLRTAEDIFIGIAQIKEIPPTM